ncbi:hypothetical protein, conserved [Leishmania lindenbergi]|uniref:Leucine-rich repeat protein n=1 Tax=Leishmania lindenbergi TaxID=651832 RepID=A0AAW3AYM7_9TRYP
MASSPLSKLRNVTSATGEIHAPLPLHLLPPSPTSATAVLYERVRLTPSALQSIIGYLPCNATTTIGNTSNNTRSGGSSLGVGGAAAGRSVRSPLIMADALFAKAAQAPSTSAATAASTGVPLTPPVPVAVTRPLAFMAASPQSRRELEMYLTGGCALPPLGSLVLQVRPHRPSPATAARPSRVGVLHASRRRAASPVQVEVAHQHDETVLAAPLALLLVSSTNVMITSLPFQPSLSPSISPIKQPQAPAMTTLASYSVSRALPPPPPMLLFRSSAPPPPARAVGYDDDVGRTPSSFSATPPPQQQYQQLSSQSTVLQSRRIPVGAVTPPTSFSPFSPVPVVRRHTSSVSAPHCLLNTTSPTSTAQEIFDMAAAGTESQAVFALGTRGITAARIGFSTSASLPVRLAHVTPSATPLPASAPPPTSAALQTLCHALWWVRRDRLPVSLSLVRYKQADTQALWAMLSEAPPPLPQERAGLVMADEGTGQPSSPMHERYGQATRALGEPRGSCDPTLASEGDDVCGGSHSADARGFRAPVDDLNRSLVSHLSEAAAVAANAEGATGITQVTTTTIASSDCVCPAGCSVDFDPALTQPICSPRASRGEGAAANDNDDTLDYHLGRPTDTVLPSLGAPAAITLRFPVTHLHVHGKAADAAMATLLPAHPEVRSLRLTHGNLSDAQLRHLACVCPGVTHLSLAMNSQIQTTTFLCPPLSDTSSVSTAVTTAATTETSRTAATVAATAMGSPNPDFVQQFSRLNQRGVDHTAVTTTTTTSMAVPALSSLSSRSTCAACDSGDDASHARLRSLWGAAAASDAGNALGTRSEGSHATDASPVPSPSHPSHTPCSVHHSSQLDLFASDEEGELEMRISLWQAAQTEAEERRQPVFILRPQDVVLGRYGGTAVEDGGGSGASMSGGGRDAAAGATATTSSRTLQGSAIEPWPPSRRWSSLHTEVTAMSSVSAHARSAHVFRKATSGAPLLRASSAAVPGAVLSAHRLPSATHASASAPIRAHADPRHDLPPRSSNMLYPDLAVSPLRPYATTLTSATVAASSSSLSLPTPHVATAAADEAGSSVASAKGVDVRATAVPSPPAPAAPVHPGPSSSDWAMEPALPPDSPRHRSRERRHHRKGHSSSSLRSRPTYWADTLVDLDLSYTQVFDEDVARDLPQLRCLHRLSLEGCGRLSQVSWLPLLLHLRELNLSLSSVQGHALHPLGSCPRLMWLMLEGCSSFTAVHQLWSREADATAVDEATAAGSVEAAPLLTALRVLIASSTGLTDAGLRFLSKMVGLECLVLDRCPGVTDVSVAATLPSLCTLDVSRTRVSAEGVAGLRLSRTLNQLRMQECPALSRLPVLLVALDKSEASTAGGGAGDEPSRLHHPKATTTGISHRLFHKCPPLAVLDLSYTRQLTADGLAGLVADEATLTAQATAAVAEHLAWREVVPDDPDGMDLAVAADEPLPPALVFPHVRHVLLRSCDAVTHIRPLRGFTNVVELDLYHTNVTEAALTAALASWTALEVLNIASTRVRSLAAWCPYEPSETLGTAAAVARRGGDGERAEDGGDLQAVPPPLPWHGRLPAFAATLRTLALSNTDITAAGLAALAFFPQLEVLQLACCRRLSSLRFLALAADGAARRSTLTELTVTGATHLTNAEAFPYIMFCPALRFLSLVGCVQLGSGGNPPGARDSQHKHLLSCTDDDVGVLGCLRGLAELNLSNTGVDLLDLKCMLRASTSPSSLTATAAQQHQHLSQHVSLSLQRLWLRGCHHLDENALISTATAALEYGEPPCDGSRSSGGGPMTFRLLPLLREVYLSHGKYGAAVLSSLLS